MLWYLFKSHCLSFYYLELWAGYSDSKSTFRNAAVTYHKAIKRIRNLSYREGNHVVCETFNMRKFKHFVNVKTISFAFRLNKSGSQCTNRQISNLTHNSVSMKFRSIVEKMYGLVNLFDNDFVKTRLCSSYEKKDMRETIYCLLFLKQIIHNF